MNDHIDARNRFVDSTTVEWLFSITPCRKSALTVSGSNSSQILSSAGIHEGARWQFCNTTQLPAD